MPNERSSLEEEALKYHLAGQSAVMEEATKAQQELPPLSTPEGRYFRGLTDESDEATEEGALFVDLMDAGLFDQTGNLTPKGQAFSLDPQVALLPQNLDAYILRDQSGLNEKPDMSFGQALSGVGSYLWDAVKGTGRMARQNPMVSPLAFFSDDVTEAENVLTNQSFAEGALEAPATLGAGGSAMLEKGWAKLTDNDRDYYAAKQKYDLFKEDLNDAEAGDLYGNLINSKATVDALNASRDQAIQKLGPRRSAEVERQGEASGAIVGDPSNYLTAGAGFIAGSAEKIPLMARISAKAEQATMAALRAEELSMQVAKAKSVLDKSSRGAQVAAQQSANLAGTGSVARADQFRSVAARLAAQADESARAIPALEQQAADAIAHSQKLAESAGGAQRVIAAIDQAKQIGRQVRSAPASAIAPALESIGNGLIQADGWVAANLKGLDKFRNTAAALGLVTGNPMAAAPAAILASGPVVRGVGNFTRVLGDELMQARGSVPFWRRVAENSNTTPLGRALSHGMDFATLGGKVPTAIRNTAKGIAAGAPVDIGFEIISEGGDMSPNTIKQGLAESLLFGGGGALGGAILKGNVNDMRARAVGDEINFRKTLSPEQTSRFSRMNPGARKNLSIYAATFPGLKFDLATEGASRFDRRTNTATINTRQSDWLRPVIAHEVNHYIQVAGQMEEGIRAMLVGDGTTGGVLRSKSGALDKNFADFMEEYNRRMTTTGEAPLSVDDAAIEYFNEATVDHLVNQTESGQLQRAAGRSKGERAIRRIVEATIPRVPIIKDLMMRVGGGIDTKGQFVQGNGLLAAGVRELPEAKTMLRNVINDLAGVKRRVLSLEIPKDTTIRIGSPKEQRPLIDSMTSAFEVDPDGNVIVDADGSPTFISKETDQSRATVGKDLVKSIDKEIEAEADVIEGKDSVDPEPLDLSDPITEEEARSETPEQKSRRVKRRENGKYEGTHLSPKVIQSLRKANKFNRQQIQNTRMLNRSARDMAGDVFLITYNKATKRDPFGQKIRYGSFGAKEMKVVPIGFKINAKGALNVEILDVTQLAENIRDRAAHPTGKNLYNGNELAIREDIEAVINLHREGKTSDAYFQKKYGKDWEKYKKFCNSVLSTKTNEQKAKNSTYEEEGATTPSVVKTVRVDRINNAAKIIGATPLPFQYEAVKANLLPLGVPES